MWVSFRARRNVVLVSTESKSERRTVRSLNKVSSRDGAIWDQTSSMATLHAPSESEEGRRRSAKKRGNESGRSRAERSEDR